MATSIKVVTLNCWGVFTPLVCPKRHERLTAIGKELSKGEYDVAMLQEIWTLSDYEKLCKKITVAMPYTHYFHSNMIGSGVCVFSKHPIKETFFHKYTVNGHAHRIQHGDWFGGKGVGLCKIDFNGLNVNIYSTHMHAEYSVANDEYLAHRVVQSFELSQFIKNTGETCDVMVVSGDFNTRPTDNGYNIIRKNAMLYDAWVDQRIKPSDISLGTTSDNPTNSFACPKRLLEFPKGERLDYLMYRANHGYSMECAKCYLTFGKVPNEDYNYSDHEAVAGIFEIKKNIMAMGPLMEEAERNKCLTQATKIIQSGLIQVQNERFLFTMYTLISVAVLLMLGFTDAPYGLSYICGFLRIIFTILMAYGLWMGIVLKTAEKNGLEAARKDILNLVGK